MLTLETIRNIQPEQVERINLGVRFEIASLLTKSGLQTRIAKFVLRNQSYISLIISGKRKNEEIKNFISDLTSAIIQTYLDNNNISEEELLLIEEEIKKSATTEVAELVK